MCLQKSVLIVLPNLRDIREHPPSLHVSLGSEIVDSVDTQSGYKEPDLVRGDVDVAAENIDWDISVDSSQIDWDIGTVEDIDDNGNGLGPYEMINASDVLQNTSPNEALESDRTSLDKEECGLHPEIPVSEISWDVSVETPQVDVIDDVILPNLGLDNQTSVPDTSSQTPKLKEERSKLLETEYRNKILDDLNEVCANYRIFVDESLMCIQCFVFFLYFYRKNSDPALNDILAFLGQGLMFNIKIMLSGQSVSKSTIDRFEE